MMQTYPNPLQDNPSYSVVKWVYMHLIVLTHSSFLMVHTIRSNYDIEGNDPWIDLMSEQAILC